MKRKLIEFLRDYILALDTVDIKQCERWKNQIDKEEETRDENPIIRPAVFIELIPGEVNNYSYGAKQTAIEVVLHFSIDDIKSDKLDSFDIVDLVDTAMQGLRNKGDGNSSPSFSSFKEEAHGLDQFATNTDHPTKSYMTILQENHAVPVYEEGTITEVEPDPIRVDVVEDIDADHE